MLKEILYLQVNQSIQFSIKKEKNKQTKYNTADQVVDMQAVNFVLNIYLFWITIDKIFFTQ